MTNRYIGIDPGSRGCIAVITEHLVSPALYDLTNNIADYWYLIEYLRDTQGSFDNSYVVVEDVCGRPGQSCVANTTFMKLAGYAELTGFYLGEMVKVKPQVWKKYFGLVFGKELTKTQKKHKSIELAKELFPSVADQLTASKDGRAEALLIAKYCQQLFKDKLNGN